MLNDRVEPQWIDAFQRVFELCKVTTGDAVVLLAETQSRALNIELARLALARLGILACQVVVPTPRQTAGVPVRSTGASQSLTGQAAALAALKTSQFIVDLTLEGLLHAPQLPDILARGARVLMISNEHPEALERLVPAPGDEATAKAAQHFLGASAHL